MKRYIIFLLIVCLFSSVFLGLSKKKEFKLLPPLTREEISGRALFRRITEEEDYENYPFWPGHEGINPGQVPHGSFHKIYIHPYLRDALPIQNRIAPPGSIIVKCNLNDRKEIMDFTIMAKVKGYSPETSDWFWAKITKNGKIIAEGRVESCIECHSIKKNNDFIIIHDLDGEVK